MSGNTGSGNTGSCQKQDSTRVIRPVWLACCAAWLLSMLAASNWDLEISASVVDTQAKFGMLIQRFGEWPAWAVVICCTFALFIPRKTYPKLNRLRPLAMAILLLALVHPLLITQTLKFFWGRIRFRDLGLGYAGYTPFYIPAGIGAGLSFPSGHVAMACAVSPMVFFFARVKNRLSAFIALAVVLVYGLSVCWGRILAGAHYTTDCLFSLGVSFLLAPILLQLLQFLSNRAKNLP